MSNINSISNEVNITPTIPPERQSTVTDIPLPKNISILSNPELLDIINIQKAQLGKYVTQFNPLSELRAEIIQLLEELHELENKFKELEHKRNKTIENSEDCQVLESKYVKEWQNVNSHIESKYSKNAIRIHLETSLKDLDSKSNELESNFNSSQNLDDYIKEYMRTRKDYHKHREKLVNWNNQDN